MSSEGNIQNFNKSPLNIKKYCIGKEKEELLTFGKCLIDLKYLIEKECNKNVNNEKNIGIKIINETNINFNININNFHSSKKNEINNNIIDGKNQNNIEIKKILSDPSSIKDLKRYSDKQVINLNNNDMKIGENNSKNLNINRGTKTTEKPVMIIDKLIDSKQNIAKEEKPKIVNEHFQIIDYIELNNNKEEEIHINKKNLYDTFCLGVFISGLSSPIQLTSIIEHTDNFRAPCGHDECSMFPSIEPDVLNTFINKNSKIFKELPPLISNMCFPLGIKPCFGCKFVENRIENSPDPQKTQQTFFNVIKNEKNDCYYMATLQYFIKMTNQEYIMKYRFNPVTYVLDKIKSINNKDKKFKNNMQNISNLLNNSNVLIPESISLISKYPFFISMEKCLRCLISLQKKEDMDNLINHLINEIPSPEKGYQIQFFIPKIEKPLVLNHQYNIFLKYNDENKISNNNILSSSQINMKILLEKITIDNIIMIFQLLILEQKILFLENDYQILSEITNIFLELIYPLVWTNPFLPVLSTKTVRFLQSPVPFVMGIDEYLLKYAINLKFFTPAHNNNLETETIIFNIMTNKFISGKNMKRIHRKDIYKEFHLPIMPSKLREYIEKELKEIKKQKKSSKEIDKLIRDVFLMSMIMLMGDYNNFIFYTEDEIPLFNQDAFVQSHKDKTSQYFLSEMVKTQIFNQFLLNEKQLHTKNKNKLKKIANNNHMTDISITNSINYELIDTSHFKKMIAKNQNLLNSEKIRNRAFSTKKVKKVKKTKDTNEEIDINNYIQINNDKLDENLDLGGVNYSIDFHKGNDKIKLNSNININDALSENYNEENANKNKKIEKLMSRAKSAKKIVNLNKVKDEKGEKEEEKEIAVNEDDIKILLLYPYFLTKKNMEEITLENIKNDIDLYSQKNNLKYLIQNSEHVFIRHNYKLNNISTKRIYLYKTNLKTNSEEINNKTPSKRNSFDINNTKTKQVNCNNIIDNQQDYKIIKETFKICYTNKSRISKTQLHSLEKIFLNEENKKYFAKLILPDIRMKNKKNHKLLTSSSFEDLSKILYISLEHLTSNEYNTCRLLTISSFVYYKIENKKLIYLYENFIRGIKPCRLWLSDEFWSNFFKLEYDEELKIKNDMLNLYKYDSDGKIKYKVENESNLIENENEQSLFETISYTAEIMYRLKLSKKFVMDTFVNKIFVSYGIDKDKKNLLLKHILDVFNNI